jgi:hypothetical protein
MNIILSLLVGLVVAYAIFCLITGHPLIPSKLHSEIRDELAALRSDIKKIAGKKR